MNGTVEHPPGFSPLLDGTIHRDASYPSPLCGIERAGVSNTRGPGYQKVLSNVTAIETLIIVH